MTISLSRFDPVAAGHVVLRATITVIDMKTVAATNLYTVPAGKKLYLADVKLECSAASAISVAASAGVGVAAGEDDVYASQALTGFTSATAPNNGWSFVQGGRSRLVPAAAIVKLGIDTGATGTSQTATARLYGSLLPA